MEEFGYILAEYGFEPEEIRPGGGTAGGSWRVRGAGGDYFLRRRGPRTSTPERIRFDHGLRRHLAEKGLPVFPPLEARGGRSWVPGEDGVYEVYPWIQGTPLDPARREREGRNAALALARLHRASLDYSGRCEPILPQFGHYPVEIPARERFDHPEALLAAVEFVAEAYGVLSRRQELAHARDRVRRLRDEYLEICERLPVGVIHGDYNACNLLFSGEGEVAGIFDFDWAWRDSRVRDVATGLFFFGGRRDGRIDGGDIWSLTACPHLELESLAAVAAAYHGEYPLSGDEIEALPVAMLGAWVAWRTEGVMKAPEEDRARFLLASFDVPFRWVEENRERWSQAVTRLAK